MIENELPEIILPLLVPGYMTSSSCLGFLMFGFLVHKMGQMKLMIRAIIAKIIMVMRPPPTSETFLCTSSTHWVMESPTMNETQTILQLMERDEEVGSYDSNTLSDGWVALRALWEQREGKSQKQSG